MRRLASAELALAAGAVVAAAVLGTLGPPVSVAYSGLLGLSASGVDSTRSVRVHLSTASDQPGANTFTVTAEDDSGHALTGLSVALLFKPLDDPDVRQTELSLAPRAGHPGTYTGVGSNLRFDGRWEVLTVVKRGRGAVGVPLELDTPTPPQQSSVQRIPGQAPRFSKLVGNLGILAVTVDPERAGPSTVTAAAYTASLGDEEPLTGMVMTLTKSDGPTRQQHLTRTGSGTFVAHLQLAHGPNEIAVIAHSRYGTRLRSVFALSVP